MDDPTAHAVFPHLGGIYIRVLMNCPTPNMEHIVTLKQYFELAEIDFNYKLDYWGYPNPTGGRSFVSLSDYLTD